MGLLELLKREHYWHYRLTAGDTNSCSWWHPYLAETLLAPRGHTHVHLAVLGGVAGGRRVVEVLLQVLHPRQQLGYSTLEWKRDFSRLSTQQSSHCNNLQYFNINIVHFLVL